MPESETVTFGDYIRALRQERTLGQRELSRRLGISAAYLNEIEKGERPAPSVDILKAMASELEIEPIEMFDLAGRSRRALPPDLQDVVRETPEIISFLRSVNNSGMPDQTIRELNKMMAQSETKALIVAAGLGSRLKSYTENLPKCMLDFAGKTLLQRQIEAFRNNGITDVSVIRGYKKNKICRCSRVLPPDLQDVVRETPEIISFLRSVNNSGMPDQTIRELNKMMAQSETKALIVAAGLGSRLKSYTENLPKCMLDFAGKTLLQRQIEAFRNNGITDVSVIRGYKKNKINYDDLTYFYNAEYRNNNILNSIICGEEKLNGNVIVSYSDILFEPEVVERLLSAEQDISIVVDIDWKKHYVGRKDHPIEEAENVVFDANGDVSKIGKILTDKHDVHGEFIGMMKLNDRGTDLFKRHFHRAKELYWDKPFQRAATFQMAYLTDMIQEMVDLGVHVHCVLIERGWREIDTIEDYKNALKELEE